jgi:hypothetical protein
MRPWLIACLLVGFLGGLISLHEDNSFLCARPFHSLLGSILTEIYL